MFGKANLQPHALGSSISICLHVRRTPNACPCSLASSSALLPSFFYIAPDRAITPSFLTLPCELRLRILDYIEDLQDIMSLRAAVPRDVTWSLPQLFRRMSLTLTARPAYTDFHSEDPFRYCTSLPPHCIEHLQIDVSPIWHTNHCWPSQIPGSSSAMLLDRVYELIRSRQRLRTLCLLVGAVPTTIARGLVRSVPCRLDCLYFAFTYEVDTHRPSSAPSTSGW